MAIQALWLLVQLWFVNKLWRWLSVWRRTQAAERGKLAEVSLASLGSTKPIPGQMPGQVSKEFGTASSGLGELPPHTAGLRT